MKTTITAILAFVFTALLAPSQVYGREAMVSDERRLGGVNYKSPEYWASIYWRCCNTEAGPSEEGQSKGNPDYRRTDIPDDAGIGDDETCQCPVRGSEKKSFWGWGPKYISKWEWQCNGKIKTKAGIKN